MSILNVEKRGCDFWDWSIEKKSSDLKNFRLYARIQSSGVFDIEICTHDRTNVHPKGIDGVSTWVDITRYDIKGLPKKDDRSFWCKPYKKDLLEKINEVFKTEFTDLKFMEV